MARSGMSFVQWGGRVDACQAMINGEPCGKPARFRIKYNRTDQVFYVCAECYDVWIRPCEDDPDDNFSDAD